MHARTHARHPGNGAEGSKAQTNRNWLMSAEGAATWADVALVKAFFLSPNCDAQNASERVNDGGCE